MRLSASLVFSCPRTPSTSPLAAWANLPNGPLRRVDAPSSLTPSHPEFFLTPFDSQRCRRPTNPPNRSRPGNWHGCRCHPHPALPPGCRCHPRPALPPPHHQAPLLRLPDTRRRRHPLRSYPVSRKGGTCSHMRSTRTQLPASGHHVEPGAGSSAHVPNGGRASCPKRASSAPLCRGTLFHPSLSYCRGEWV